MGRQNPSGSRPSNEMAATDGGSSGELVSPRQKFLNTANELTENLDNLMQLLDSTTLALSDNACFFEDTGQGTASAGSFCRIRPPSPPSASVYLPAELICEIISYITDQKSLYYACLVSRAWYSAATPQLYEKPRLNTSNIAPFVAAVAPTIQAPTKKLTDGGEYQLSDLVKELDLLSVGKIEHISSWIGRLLSHCRRSLVYFRAPAHGLGATVTRLKYPDKLVHLDLSNCVESIELTSFCRAIMNLQKLTVLKFPPTSSINVVEPVIRRFRIRAEQVATHPLSFFQFPPLLQQLFLCGNLGDSFLMSSRHIPESVRVLSLSHFPFARPDSLRVIILNFAPQITTLYVYHPIPRLQHDFCDKILILCPFVKRLGISVDYCTSHLFDEENTPRDHPLEELYMRASTNVWRRLKVTADDISIALMEGRLRRLRVVQASKRLDWEQEMDKLEDLQQMLQMDRTSFDFDDVESNGEEDADADANADAEADEELPTVAAEAGVWLTEH